MTTKEKLRRRIIELIHGLPFEEAIKEDSIFKNLSESKAVENIYLLHKEKDKLSLLCSHITLSRVMQALENSIKEKCPELDELGEVTIEWKNNNPSYSIDVHYYSTGKSDPISEVEYLKFKIIRIWKLLKDNKETATLEDQTEETIEALWNLIK